MNSRLSNLKPHQKCEWGKARVVIMHEPGIETIFGVLTPHSSNFLKGFSIKKAFDEHRRYRREIERSGAKVYDILDLLRIAYNLNHKVLDDLRKYVSYIVEFKFEDGLDKGDMERVYSEFVEYINSAELEELVNILLLKPRIRIRYNRDKLDYTTEYIAKYDINPVHNLLYMRDPLITTSRGIVIGRYRLPIRRRENDIVEFIFRESKLGVYYRIKRGFLEGGDFMPAGDFVFQGVGLLSSEKGVLEAMKNNVYGDVEVGVVIDPRPNMEEMHLDGYMNILSNDLVMISENRIDGELEPTVRVYEAVKEGGYKLTSKKRLKEYLKEKGIDIVEVSTRDHNNLAENYLLLEKKKLIGLSRISDGLKNKLEEIGVKGIYLDFDNLIKGYGGPHCLTQVILRDKC